MTRVKPPLVALGVVTAAALSGALAFESVYQVTIRPRPPDPILHAVSEGSAPKPQAPSFTLRLADSGGVGVPLTEWGADYSHDRRTFRDVILLAPPYLDGAAFRRVEREWQSYVDRMLEYGNNAIVVPLLLELMDFDRLSIGSEGVGRPRIYGDDSPFRARHAAVRAQFASLFDWAARRGAQVFLDTDMLAVTPPLFEFLRRVAPDGAAGIDAANPAVWEVYRSGLHELFDALPTVSGIVIRFGEGGALYNSDDWPYRSEVAVRHAAALRAMLRGLLPLFEAEKKTLVLRSWTVGVGQLGRLHVDPRLYDAVLGDIDSPSLIVSTKFTAGDFFSYLPLNPTLASGRHRRLIELQGKPEFEGFGAFPNFLGAEYARALRAFRAANPRIVGTYVLSQFGGPLRAGPRMLYPLHGCWVWTDANVFVASRLAADQNADVDRLTRSWAAARFGADEQVVRTFARILNETRAAVLTGFYIRPFAERQVRVPGLELPPLMWIFEWDMVGGWSSLLSIVYKGAQHAVQRAIDEGHAAAAAVRKARREIQAVVEAAGTGACSSLCDEALRSLEYQETLFDALAEWRHAFLSYYRWIDTADGDAWSQWRSARERFDAAAAAHVSKHGTDLTFPAFDFASAQQALSSFDRTAIIRPMAVATLLALGGLLAVGSVLDRRRHPHPAAAGLVCRLGWLAVVAPDRLADEKSDLRACAAVTVLVLIAIGLVAGMVTDFAAASIAVAFALTAGSVAVAFASAAVGVEARGHVLVAPAGALLPAVLVLAGVIAYGGSPAVWYWFWISPVFRVALLTVMLGTILWMAFGMLRVNSSASWPGRIGNVLLATGAGFVVLMVLVPEPVDVLRRLNHPLNIAPATDTMLFALTTYAGANLDARALSWAPGTIVTVLGYGLRRWSVRAPACSAPTRDSRPRSYAE